MRKLRAGFSDGSTLPTPAEIGVIASRYDSRPAP